jgi:streptomycin 6-kinase
VRDHAREAVAGKSSACRFNFALEIGRVRPARQRDNAVVFEHLGIERVELWIVDVGLDDTLFEILCGALHYVE